MSAVNLQTSWEHWPLKRLGMLFIDYVRCLCGTFAFLLARL